MFMSLRWLSFVINFHAFKMLREISFRFAGRFGAVAAFAVCQNMCANFCSRKIGAFQTNFGRIGLVCVYVSEFTRIKMANKGQN